MYMLPLIDPTDIVGVVTLSRLLISLGDLSMTWNLLSFFQYPQIQIPFSLQIEEADVEGCPKSQQLLLGQGDRFQKGQILNVLLMRNSLFSEMFL